MTHTALIAQRLAQRLNWSRSDARLALDVVTAEASGLTPEGASEVVLVLNQSVTEMSIGMASVIILAASYRAGVSDQDMIEETVIGC